jgi:hypothetical protein
MHQLIQTTPEESNGLGRKPSPGLREGAKVEVHFGKPVVARVRKCRLVVVKKKRTSEDGDESSQR